MFRTDASLKSVARRGPATATRCSGSIGSASTVGGIHAAAPGGREAAVEQARLEREAREHKRRAASHAVRMQARTRRAAALRWWGRSTRAALAQQLDDVAKVAAAFGAVGLPFAPPAATAHSLMRPLLCVWAIGNVPLAAADSALLGRLATLVLLPSLRSPDGASNLASAESLAAAAAQPRSKRAAALASASTGFQTATAAPTLTKVQQASTTKGAIPAAAAAEALAVQLRLRRLVSACLDLAAAAVNDACISPGAAANAAAGLAAAAVSCEGSLDALACVECLAHGRGVSAAARTVCLETLRRDLVARGRLRQVLLRLPEPRAVAGGFVAGGSGDNGSGANGSDWCGGCVLPAAGRSRLHALMGALWRLTIHCVQPTVPAAGAACLPPPSSAVLATFAAQVLSVPLLFWRQDGKDYGRLVLGAGCLAQRPLDTAEGSAFAEHSAAASGTGDAAASTSSSGSAGSSSAGGASVADALGTPALWYSLLHALAATFAAAREAGQPLGLVLPPSGHSSVSSDHWLLGNLIVLGRRSCFTFGTPGYAPPHRSPLSPSRGSSHTGGAQAPLCAGASVLDGGALLDLLASLLEAAPLGVFSDTAAVTWASHGVSHTPVSLPPPLLAQARSLVEGRSAGAFLDALAFAALGGGVAPLVDALAARSAQDDADEASLHERHASGAAGLGALSAADLALADAKRKRRNGWLDATWAHRVAISTGTAARAATQALAGLFTGSVRRSEPNGGGSGGGSGSSGGCERPAVSPLRSAAGLLDTSHTARAAAHGEVAGGGGGGVALAAQAATSGSGGDRDTRLSPLPPRSLAPGNGGPPVAAGAAVRPLARFLAVLFRRWLSPVKGGQTSRATTATPLVFWLLNSLALSSVVAGRPRLVQGLWAYLQHAHPKPEGSHGGSGSVCAVLCCLMSQLLVVLDDSELLEKPLEGHQLRRFVKWHKERLFRLVWTDYDKGTSSGVLSEQQAFLRATVAKCLRDLYDRSSRRPFLAPQAWLVAAVSDGGRALAEVQGFTPKGRRLLAAMPYCLPFADRLRLFQQKVATDKAATQASGAPGLRVRIRRARLLEDGLRELNGRGRDLRRRLYVEFENEYGAAETGVDAGGLFKEFWTDLSSLAFNVDFGLFRTTPEGGMLYPSPAAAALHGERESLELFGFLGRVLGKALYEGLTVEPKFAHFFLAHLRGPYNYLNTWHDLSTLDAELHKNLMFLKTYAGDAADLSLTFTVADDSGLGAAVGAQVELVSGGARLEVTNRNKLEFIERVANHLLVRQLRAQSEAFKRGLAELVDLEHLAMFNEAELQVLVSGDSHASMDVSDLQKHCRLAGGFTSYDRTVQRFWRVVASLDAREQALLLRFVTSCPRPPPLGFEHLHPPFCLQRIPVSSDDEKLPSAATCFNTLKLPTYSSEKVMKTKLLLSITSNSGFELT